MKSGYHILSGSSHPSSYYMICPLRLYHIIVWLLQLPWKMKCLNKDIKVIHNLPYWKKHEYKKCSQPVFNMELNSQWTKHWKRVYIKGYKDCMLELCTVLTWAETTSLFKLKKMDNAKWNHSGRTQASSYWRNWKSIWGSRNSIT